MAASIRKLVRNMRAIDTKYELLREAMQALIAADVAKRKRSAQWLKDNGQFIPLPATYLHQERFADGFTEPPRLSERTVNVLKGFEESE